MARTKISANKAAAKLALIALRALKKFTPSEQEKRIRAAQRLIRTNPGKPAKTRLN
jgi:hypothetical protein